MRNYNLAKAKANAKKLNLTVKPSSNPKKKLDVFQDGKKINSIGDPMGLICLEYIVIISICFILIIISLEKSSK